MIYMEFFIVKETILSKYDFCTDFRRKEFAEHKRFKSHSY